MDLLKESDAYIYGLFLADGCLSESTRNRGKLRIELSIRDIEVLYRIESFFSGYSCRIGTRRRDTNFKKDYESCSLTFHSLDLRTNLKSLGFPAGNKSEIANVPNCGYNAVAFWRGYLDGNGSFCISSKNIPLVSMGTKSESLKEAYVRFLKEVTGEQKQVNRNKRDNFYNIISYRERALELVKCLNYATAEVFITRKREAALNLLEWSRN